MQFYNKESDWFNQINAENLPTITRYLTSLRSEIKFLCLHLEFMSSYESSHLIITTSFRHDQNISMALGLFTSHWGQEVIP